MHSQHVMIIIYFVLSLKYMGTCDIRAILVWIIQHN